MEHAKNAVMTLGAAWVAYETFDSWPVMIGCVVFVAAILLWRDRQQSKGSPRTTLKLNE